MKGCCMRACVISWLSRGFYDLLTRETSLASLMQQMPRAWQSHRGGGMHGTLPFQKIKGSESVIAYPCVVADFVVADPQFHSNLWLIILGYTLVVQTRGRLF